MRLTPRSVVATLLICLALGVLFASAQSQKSGANDKCISNAKHLISAITLYTQDYDETFPVFNNVVELQVALSPYLHTASGLHCPVTSQYYRFNTALSGVSFASIASPDMTEFLRDATSHPDGSVTIAYLSGRTTLNGVSSSSTNDCLSHAHQTTLAIQMYAQDYDEILPPFASQTSGSVQMTKSFSLLLPYTKNNSVFTCPATNLYYHLNTTIGGKPLASLGDFSQVLLFKDTKPHRDYFLTQAYLDGYVVHGPETYLPPGQTLDDLCTSRAKRIASGMQEYVQDWDEKYPPMHNPAEFMQALLPHTHASRVFHCPITGLPYQPNADLSFVSQATLANPTAIVAFQDEKSHPNGKVTTGYADGHTEQHKPVLTT